VACFDHTYGVEIECYLPEGSTAADAAAAINARLGATGRCAAESYNHLTRDHWKIVPDGSLGDYARGIEVVSPVLRGEAGLEALSRVMDALEDFGCTVSRRCGLHVHVGVGPRRTDFFRRLLKAYAHFEPVIDSLMPPSRRASANLYCRSVTHIAFTAIDAAVSLSALIGLMSARAEARYHKLNLAAHRRYGTVEFRQHSGTLDATKARNWTLLCLRLVDAIIQGRDPRAAAVAPGQINRAPADSKARLVGDLMLRPQGVSRPEAMAATGWPSISLPQQAAICGLSFTTQRTGNRTRYFARAAQASSATPATLAALLQFCGCAPAECAYFRARAQNLSPQVQWAA
jgi:hypothetical protein